MIDTRDDSISNCLVCDIMEECSHQCIRRTFYAVLVGVSPILICLIFIGLARLVLHRLEIIYYRRQKLTDRRSSLLSYRRGRLVLSYTPVSNAELQRIIQGDYHSQQTNEHSPVGNNYPNTKKTPRFIRSILPKREPTVTTSSILANLVIRRNALDAGSLAGFLTPFEAPLQPSFAIINEKDKERSSTITATKEIEEAARTLSMINKHSINCGDNKHDSDNVPATLDFHELEQAVNDHFMIVTKTMPTNAVTDEFLEFHSVSSLPCASSMRSSITENDDDRNL